MPKVLAKRPNARLQMVGRGDREPYQRLAENLGVAHALKIGPAVPHDQLVSTMRRFSIFCMPSRRESFGVSALEAAACGLPVVASRIGGVPEIVEEGGSGLLVDSENEVQLAEALIRLLGDSFEEIGNGEQGAMHRCREIRMGGQCRPDGSPLSSDPEGIEFAMPIATTAED